MRTVRSDEFELVCRKPWRTQFFPALERVSVCLAGHVSIGNAQYQFLRVTNKSDGV